MLNISKQNMAVTVMSCRRLAKIFPAKVIVVKTLLFHLLRAVGVLKNGEIGSIFKSRRRW